jgi:flagellar basal body rod protein FlgG
VDLLLSQIGTGMMAAERSLSLYADAVANVNTPGYHALLPIAQALPQEAVTANLSVSAGATVLSQVSSAEGPLIPGVSPLDVAIEGPGSLVASAGGATYYTRVGALSVDGAGRLVLPGGAFVLSTRGQPITVPTGTTGLRVAADGTVVGRLPSGASVQLGQLQVVAFPNPSGLTAVGGGLLAASADSGAPQPTRATLVSGMLEGSDVDLATVLPGLMVAENTFRMQAAMAGIDQQMMSRLDQIA